jgi:hypothetical protein
VSILGQTQRPAPSTLVLCHHAIAEYGKNGISKLVGGFNPPEKY